MTTKIALMVVYNHRYDKNIPIVESLYRGKFSHVYHLVPFYDGNMDNVIAVYDNSYFFHGYIAQAYQHIEKLGFTHFLIVADDMVLNPSINEDNLWDQLGISKDDCYISRLDPLQERTQFWPWMSNALKYKRTQPGVEIQKFLPTKEDALRRFSLYNLPTGRIPLRRLITRHKRCFYDSVIKQLPFSLSLDYPLVSAYSDIFLVTGKNIGQFFQILGVFAATRLFVELAIPTALVLTLDNLRTDNDVKLKRGDMWFGDRDPFGQQYGFKLSSLIKNYPSNKLFVHPVKLSKWDCTGFI